MRDKEVSSPSESVCLLLTPLLLVCLYCLYHHQLHTFKQQWKAQIETAVSSLTSKSHDLDYSFKSSTSKLLLQTAALQAAYEAEAEACRLAASDIRLAVSKLQLECQSELNAYALEEQMHSPFHIATPKKNRRRRESDCELNRANAGM